MHFFELTSPSAPARLVRLAVCTLLPAFIPDAAAGGMQSPSFGRSMPAHTPPSAPPAPAPQSSPYLLVCLPPPLRFAEPVEPSDPVSGLPIALAPPHPGGLIDEIAALNQEAAMTASAPGVTPSASSSPSAIPTVPSAPSASAASATPGLVPTSPDTPPAGVSILPDDTPRAIRPEDVLLYFQLPGSSPATGLPPRSSATYQQQ
jgi:hypothetical protein